MKKLVLIGASGFIGSRLIDLLGPENCQNIDKAQSAKFSDITTLYDIRNNHLQDILPPSAETIVLLAAEHRDDVVPVSLYFDVNVKGTKNVLEAMDRRGIQKIIFTSSAAVYGLNKDNPDEKFPTEPTSYYGKSKKKAEELLIKWQAKDPQKRSLTIIRSAVVFGENNRGNVFNLLQQISRGRFIMIGNGENKKSMAYVENIAEFIRYCIVTNNPGCRIINFADKPDLTMNQLIAQVEDSLDKKLPSIRLPYWLGRMGGYGFDVLSSVTGIKFPITGIRIKKFCASTQLNAAQVNSLDFQAPYTLAEGLDRTLKNEFKK
jgi:nucleoside-diphosphate-sugar epimerase